MVHCVEKDITAICIFKAFSSSCSDIRMAVAADYS